MDGAAPAVVGAASDEASVRQRSIAKLVAIYWKPVYKHARLRWEKSSEGGDEPSRLGAARAPETAARSASRRDRHRRRTSQRSSRSLPGEELVLADLRARRTGKGLRRVRQGGDATPAK